MELPTQYPLPHVLMTVNFDNDVDAETKFLVMSGVTVGAIQQVFLFFDQQQK